MFFEIYLLIVLSFCYFIYHRLTFWKRQGIPNDVASIYSRFAKPFHISDQDAYLKFGPVVGTYEGLRPTLMLCDPELIKKVLVEEFWNFPNHRIFYHEDQVAGKNIVVLEDEKWKRIRQILSPVFSPAKLRNMKDLFDECVDSLICNLEEVSEKGEVVDVKGYFGAFSLDIIASAAFATKINSIKNPDNEIVTNIRNFFGHNISLKALIILFFPCLMKWFNLYLLDYDVLVFLNRLTHSILKSRKLQLKSGIIPRKDFIRLLMEAKGEDGKSGLTQEEIADQVILFMVAGYDTSAASLSSIAYCLALHPDVQEKLFQEIQSFEKNDQKFSYDDLNQLKYLDAVIKETLRYLPLVPRIERRSNKNCYLGSLYIPKDTVVVIPIYALNHDPQYFENPEKFDPERFLEGFEEKKRNNIYIPFAIGPRACIGMRFAQLELKTCLVRVLSRFKFEVSLETQVPLEYFTGQPVSTAKSVKLKVTRR